MELFNNNKKIYEEVYFIPFERDNIYDMNEWITKKFLYLNFYDFSEIIMDNGGISKTFDEYQSSHRLLLIEIEDVHYLYKTLAHFALQEFFLNMIRYRERFF
jgi:hypothetical protein